MKAEPDTPRRPPRLEPGGTVAVVAPASPFDAGRFRVGLDVVRELGFHVAAPDEIHARRGFLAGSDARRSALLQRVLADPAVDAVICARGGWGSMRVLPRLDFDALSGLPPKIFVGFSDASSLLWSLHSRCRMTVFHGPMVLALADASEPTRRALVDALCSPRPVAIAAGAPDVLRRGRAEGRVICGNLTTLCHLTGTPFAPSFDDSLLLLEDTGEAPYRIDRMLTQMDMAGRLAGLRGLALGAFTDCGDAREVRRVFAEHFAPRDIPVLAGFPVGHAEPNLTVPVGERAVLDTDEGTLRFFRAGTVSR